MRPAFALPLALGTLLATLQPAPPASAQGSALTDCRALLLRIVDKSCGPQNPCPQPDLVAADDACQQAVVDDPANGEARLFRAYTRLMRLAEEDHAGPDFRTTLQGIFDRSGFSTDGEPDQYDLTADGRSLVEFTSVLPEATDPASFGRGDGSISKGDPFAGAWLEAGAYVLAIGAYRTDVEEVVQGAARFANTYTVLGNEIDGYRRALSDHGDYRIQVTGDVDTSTFEGSLTYDSENDTVSVDRIGLNVLSDGPVVFDVLSWEQGIESPGGHTNAPIDLNGDGEIAFFNAELFLFRDDGSSPTGNAPGTTPRSICPRTRRPVPTSSTTSRTPGSRRSRLRSPTWRRSPTRGSRSRSHRTPHPSSGWASRMRTTPPRARWTTATPRCSRRCCTPPARRSCSPPPSTWSSTSTCSRPSSRQ